jgi:hypothetical protein
VDAGGLHREAAAAFPVWINPINDHVRAKEEKKAGLTII